MYIGKAEPFRRRVRVEPEGLEQGFCSLGVILQGFPATPGISSMHRRAIGLKEHVLLTYLHRFRKLVEFEQAQATGAEFLVIARAIRFHRITQHSSTSPRGLPVEVRQGARRITEERHPYIHAFQ